MTDPARERAREDDTPDDGPGGRPERDPAAPGCVPPAYLRRFMHRLPITP